MTYKNKIYSFFILKGKKKKKIEDKVQRGAACEEKHKTSSKLSLLQAVVDCIRLPKKCI